MIFLWHILPLSIAPALSSCEYPLPFLVFLSEFASGWLGALHILRSIFIFSRHICLLISGAWGSV